MSLDRRSFCASFVASAMSFQSRVAVRNSVLHSAQIVDVPTSVDAFTEDGLGALKRTRTAWSDSGIEVETEPNAQNRSLGISVSCPQKKLLRIRVEWKGSLAQADLFLGDAWERSYGDLGWRPMEPDRILPWYFLTGSSRGMFAGFGVETNPSALCFWQVTPSGVVLWLDVRNGGSGVELGNRVLPVATVISEEYVDESGFAAARKFCRRMARGSGISMPAPLYGGNNWYYAYGKSSTDDILADTERVGSWAPSGGNRPFMVIDDGWSPYRTTGPWDRGNERFPDMANLAAKMLTMDVKPGLWFRPLTTHDALPEALLLKSKFTQALYAREQKKTLDPTVEGAAAQIEADVTRLCGWGFRLLKHDFSTYDLLGRWGFQMGADVTDSQWSFADRSRTNAEIIRAFYASLRKAAGKTALLGCNTIGHLATGLFEIQRTGDDTSGREWGRTRKMGVNTLAFRAPQQGIFFDVDADCVGLTKAIPWASNKRWLDLLAHSGTPLFVSAAPDAIQAEQRSALREAFAAAARRQPICEPLDWMKTDRPEKWLLNGKAVDFDWYADDHSLPA